jgi:hypothetical protein
MGNTGHLGILFCLKEVSWAGNDDTHYLGACCVYSSTAKDPQLVSKSTMTGGDGELIFWLQPIKQMINRIGDI